MPLMQCFDPAGAQGLPWNDGGHALVSEDVDAARAWVHAQRDALVTARDGQE